jgi:hypothetical protein
MRMSRNSASNASLAMMSWGDAIRLFVSGPCIRLQRQNVRSTPHAAPVGVDGAV